MQAASINCPSCGHSFVHGGGVREPQPELALTRADRLSDIQDQIRCLDASISRLNQERANLLRKVNTICDKTSHIPSEILSHIFQFVRPPIDFRQHIPFENSNWLTECLGFRRDTYHREEDDHFKLIGVSSRWRQIVLSTPQLWTTISIGVWKAFTTSHVSLLGLYARCSGDLGLSIELDFRYHAARWIKLESRSKREASLILLEPIFEAVFTRLAPTIRHLTLLSPPPEILHNIAKGFSLCNSLAIVDEDIRSIYPPAVAVELPRLERMFLQHYYCPFILPWLSITDLDLEYVPESAAYHIIKECLYLVKLRNYGGRILYESIQEPMNTEPIVHNNLESMLCDDTVDLYRRFRYTRLRNLHWDDLDHDPQYHGLRHQIFSNLPSTLVSLTLREIPEDQSHARELLACIPQLLELRLFDCSNSAINFVIWSIGRPAWPSDGEASTMVGPTVLPNLRRLSIVSDHTVALEWIVDMLEALFTTRTSEEGFHLEVSEIIWHEVTAQRLQKLVSSGFHVEITTDVEIPENSRNLPWW